MSHVSHRLVCVTNRTVNLCHNPDHEHLIVSSKWRPPTATNDKAWARIAAGHINWDDRAVVRSQRRRSQSVEQRRVQRPQQHH